MILIPEQISYLREKRGTILNNLATYKDYLKNVAVGQIFSSIQATNLKL